MGTQQAEVEQGGVGLRDLALAAVHRELDAIEDQVERLEVKARRIEELVRGRR